MPTGAHHEPNVWRIALNFRYFRLEELIALEGDAVGSEMG